MAIPVATAEWIERAQGSHVDTIAVVLQEFSSRWLRVGTCYREPAYRRRRRSMAEAKKNESTGLFGTERLRGQCRSVAVVAVVIVVVAVVVVAVVVVAVIVVAIVVVMFGIDHDLEVERFVCRRGLGL